MKLLLDTHTFLWFIADNPRLSGKARELLEEDNELLLSTASLWEVAIKFSLGKLTLAAPYKKFMAEQLENNSITMLSITMGHLDAVASLPFHHRDPFDRLLIAQAIVEAIPIVSVDLAFDAYPIGRLW